MDHINLLGSIVIAGIFLLSAMGFYGQVIEHGHEQSFELLTQETAMSLLEILDYDLHRLGVGAPDPFFAVIAADSASLTFLGDVTRDGVADTVSYSLSDTTEATSTPNPSDRIFYRLVNGAVTIGEAFGVVELTFVFLDEVGAETTDPAVARTIEVQLRVESPFEYDGGYATAFVRQRVAPPMWVRPSHLDF